MKWGCINCGTVDGKVSIGWDAWKYACGECGEHMIITPQVAFDLLIEVYQQGNLPQHFKEFIDEMEIDE